MEIAPIKNERDYDGALRRVEALWAARKGTPEGDELDLLATLIDSYEREHYPVDFPDPIDAIRFRLEQRGQDWRSLLGVIGHRSRVYEVMHGQRRLSLNMIRKLHDRFGIPADVLIQPVRKNKTRRRGITAAAKHSRSAMKKSA